MSSLEERKAKLEKMKKEKEERERAKQMKAVAMQEKQQPPTASNAFINSILKETKISGSPSKIDDNENQQQQQIQPQLIQSSSSTLSELKIATYVIEIGIPPKPRNATYDREIQVDLIDIKPQISPDGKGQDFKSTYRREEEEEEDPNSAIAKRTLSLQVGLVAANTSVEDPSSKQKGKKQNDEDIDEEEEENEDEDRISGLQAAQARGGKRQTKKVKGNDPLAQYFDEPDKDSSALQKGDKITQLFSFMDDQPIKRAITSIEWSPKVSQLLLCSYSKYNEWKVDEPDGYINIFSLNQRKKPEITLTSQYEVTKAIFNPFQPNVVIGATYSGYILYWDIRAKTQPIQKSCLAKNGHNHPIYSLGIVGSQNAHNIVSISNDGKLCSWSLDMLNESKIGYPLIQQSDKGEKSSGATSSSASTQENHPINAMCMDFPEDETDKFYVGSEDFNIYECNLHSNSQNHIDQTLYGHQAPVTKVHMHPGTSQSDKIGDISDLLLSSSLDWTIKLWYPKIKCDPIMTFESSQEYVYDVQWSPVHPSLFASCDGDGFIDLWDLNQDTESPIFRKKTGDKALNCLRWSLDGRKLITGDSNGVLSMWQVDKEISIQKEADFQKLDRLIAQNQHSSQSSFLKNKQQF